MFVVRKPKTYTCVKFVYRLVYPILGSIIINIMFQIWHATMDRLNFRSVGSTFWVFDSSKS